MHQLFNITLGLVGTFGLALREVDGWWN